MDCDSWELFRKWIETGSLIAVAIIALFQERIRSKLNRADLRLNIQTAIPSRTYFGKDREKISFFLLMQLKNLKEARPSVKTRVLLTQIYKKNNEGRYVGQRLDSPLQMLWSPAELHYNDPFPTIVKPRVVDLGCVSRDEKEIFVPRVVIYPNNFQGSLMPVADLPYTHYAIYGFEFDSENSKPKNPNTLKFIGMVFGRMMLKK